MPEHPSVCFRCGECCTRYQVLLDSAEMERVADFLGISIKKLTAEYTDPRWPVPGKFLLKHRDNDGCIFLIHRGKEALCSIHIAKPNTCREWTPALSRKECSRGLLRAWGLTVNENEDICGSEQNKSALAEYLKSFSSEGT